MLEAYGKSAWNLRNDRKTPNYWRVLSSSARDSYDNLFKSPSKNCSLSRRQKDEVLVSLERRLDLIEKTFFSTLKALTLT